MIFLNFLAPDPLNLPLPILNNSQKYQFSMERNSIQAKFTEEIKEFFDGANNVGVSINNLAGIETRNYAYYDTNELLLVESEFISIKKSDLFQCLI